MKFNSSISIDDDYWQSDDHYIELDKDKKTIQLRKYRVRYGPGDDYQTLMDDEFSLAEFESRDDLQTLVTTWFSETTLQALMDKIAELR